MDDAHSKSLPQPSQNKLLQEPHAEKAAAAATAGGATEDAVVTVAWCDYRGVLAVLWASGTLAILEVPRSSTGGGASGWDVISWFKACSGSSVGKQGTTGPVIPLTAAVTLCWSYHSLLLAVGDSLEVFAFHDHLEVCTSLIGSLWLTN